MAKNTEAHTDRVENLAMNSIGSFSTEHLTSTPATSGPVVGNSRTTLGMVSQQRYSATVPVGQQLLDFSCPDTTKNKRTPVYQPVHNTHPNQDSRLAGVGDSHNQTNPTSNNSYWYGTARAMH